MKHSDKWIKNNGLKKLQEKDFDDTTKKYHQDIILHALDIKDEYERISYIYDELCDYLDNIFLCENVCGFKDNICSRRRDLMTRKKKDTYVNGCCHSYIRNKDCKNLKDGHCTIKNVGCKLFTCHYLRKQGKKYTINQIFFAKYFLTDKQKKILTDEIFIPKEEVLEKMKIKK